jgi:hypothetical protein
MKHNPRLANVVGQDVTSLILAEKNKTKLNFLFEDFHTTQ